MAKKLKFLKKSVFFDTNFAKKIKKEHDLSNFFLLMVIIMYTNLETNLNHKNSKNF